MDTVHELKRRTVMARTTTATRMDRPTIRAATEPARTHRHLEGVALLARARVGVRRSEIGLRLG